MYEHAFKLNNYALGAETAYDVACPCKKIYILGGSMQA